MGSAKAREDGKVVGTGAALVGGENAEGLGGADFVGLDGIVLELELGDGGASTSDVAGRGVDEEVLACAVEARVLGDAGSADEAVPSELVDIGVVRAPGVGHEYGDIVSRVGDESIDDEALALGLSDVGADCFHHALRGLGVPADGAYVRLDD